MDDILDSRIYNHQSNVLFIGMGMMWVDTFGNQ
jgi:hypothetical protein